MDTNSQPTDAADEGASVHPDQPPLSRRRFLGRTAAIGATAALGGTTFDLPLGALGRAAGATEIGPVTGAARADAARSVRVAAADFQRRIPLPAHPDNGDEGRYADRWASFTKALQHGPEGIVVRSEYDKLLFALRSGNAADFERLSLPGPRKIVNPLAAYAYSLEGGDSHSFAIPPAPAATSDQLAGEMAELYWMALCRDIPFDRYGAEIGIIPAAVLDLNRFRDVRAPKVPALGGVITPQTLFRDVLPDSLVGRFISQYLLQTVPYGAQQILQTSRRRPAGTDHLTTYDEWLGIQRGVLPTPLPPDPSLGYIRTGRDLAEWVHSDLPAQACLSAALIIAAQGNLGDAKVSPGINDTNNPYSAYADQSGFVTFGNQAFLDLVTRVMQVALQAAWYQKWLVHRRLRPEEYGGRVHGTLRRGRSFPIGDQLLASLNDPRLLGRVVTRWGGYLLPSAFVEGSPTHPAYPSGHSTYVAAGVTMIKAFVDGTLRVSDPVRVADPYNGDTVTPIDAELTINGELDKLVMNVGIARLFAGVHWRSDHTHGVRLGEEVAIRALQDLARTYAEPFAGWQLRRFDGATVTISSTTVAPSQAAA